MITMKKNGATLGIDPTEFYGLSTDEKPTKANNASMFYEMDTKKIFMFDEQNKRWLEQ